MQWCSKIRSVAIFIALLVALSVPEVQAQKYYLLFDEDASPYEGASFFTSTYNFYKYLDDRFVLSSAGKTDLQWDLARAGHLAVNYALSSYFAVFEHEVFGHGYRAREFNFSAIGYDIHIASGATWYYSVDFNKLDIYQQNALNAAGMEANTVLSQEIRQPWFFSERIDNRDAMFYLLNQLGQLRYVYRTSANNIQDGNDINNYIRGVNRYYGNTSTLSNPKMRAYILADLLDPALYYSLYGLGKYLVAGSEHVKMYMFDIYGYQYLPTMRTILAPYGIEFQLQNFIKNKKEQLFQINLRYGSNEDINTFGIDFNVAPIWHYKKYEFANYFSVWRQPKLIYANAAVAKQALGFAEFARLKYHCTKKFALLVDMGYKTTGFLQGFILSNCAIVRLGCEW